VLQRLDHGSRPRDQDVDGETDQLGCEVGEPLGLILRISPLDDEVLPLHVAQLVQPLQECLLPETSSRLRDRVPGTERIVADAEPADAGHLPRLLRVGDKRSREDAEGEGDEESNKTVRHGRLRHSRMCRGHSTRHVPKREIKFCR
jgi:hypothetical protein